MVIPADLAPDKIRARLRSRLVARGLEVLAEVGSTNEAAMVAGDKGEPEGLAILADRQTAGRGRRGRAWASPPGVGLYTSILLRPNLPPNDLALLTLVAGLGAAEAIREVTTLTSRLKWPNDVLVDGAKVSGILTELASEGSTVCHAVVGIGINVNHDQDDLPAEVRPLATSLRLLAGRMIARADLAAAVYNGLDHWYHVLCDGGAQTILEQARAWNATLGNPVEVIAGEERWQGLAVDLDADGALLVRDSIGELRRVVAGDVSIRQPLTG